MCSQGRNKTCKQTEIKAHATGTFHTWSKYSSWPVTERKAPNILQNTLRTHSEQNTRQPRSKRTKRTVGRYGFLIPGDFILEVGGTGDKIRPTTAQSQRIRRRGDCFKFHGSSGVKYQKTMESYERKKRKTFHWKVTTEVVRTLSKKNKTRAKNSKNRINI